MTKILTFLTKQQRSTGTHLRDLAVYVCPYGHGTFSHPVKAGVTEFQACPLCKKPSKFSHVKYEAAPYKK